MESLFVDGGLINNEPFDRVRDCLIELTGEIKHLQGAKAIACGTLGGFGGFLNKEFCIHDFFLGRANCEKFLRDYFTIPADTTNPIFRNGYQDIPDHLFTSQVDGKRQIIPIFTERSKEPYFPKFSSGTNWPVLKKKDIEQFRPMLKKRVRKVVKKADRVNAVDHSIACLYHQRFCSRQKSRLYSEIAERIRSAEITIVTFYIINP